jgi:valyl-tRNA synthetase
MGRNFANKIWNASRLILQGAHPEAAPRVELVSAADRWIFSRLATVTEEVNALYASYEFDDIARVLYRFVWNELCDWYLEVAKSRLYSEDEQERLQVSGNLLMLLEHVTALLHPLMPFVTEEIYGYIPWVSSGLRPSSLFGARYPRIGEGWRDPEAERGMEAFMTVVSGLRSTREELGLARDVVGRVVVVESEPGAGGAIAGMRDAFRTLSGCELIELHTMGSGVAGDEPGESPPKRRFASIEGPGVKALLDLEGLVDVDRERERLLNKARKAQADAMKARAKLENQAFVAKAPEAVVAEERARLSAAESILTEVRLQYEERIGGELPVLEETRK